MHSRHLSVFIKKHLQPYLTAGFTIDSENNRIKLNNLNIYPG